MPNRLGEWLEANQAAAVRLATALREAIATAMSALPPASVLDEAAAAVERVTAALAPHVPDGGRERFPLLGAVSGPTDVMPFDPIVGRLSPIAPPLVFDLADGRTTASIAFTIPYQGPPGCVHGGVIAACFDQVLNVANMTAGVAGPTVSLEVRYRKPTPLGETVRFEADPPEVDGRQVRTTGRLQAGDTLLAEATGRFVTLPVDRVMALTSERR